MMKDLRHLSNEDLALGLSSFLYSSSNAEIPNLTRIAKAQAILDEMKRRSTTRSKRREIKSHIRRINAWGGYKCASVTGILFKLYKHGDISRGQAVFIAKLNGLIK